MGRVLTAEFLKLKGSPALWVSAVGVVSAPLLTGLLMGALGAAVGWAKFMNQSIAFVVFLGSVLFGLVAAYLFGREYTEDTLKSLLTAPVQRAWIIVAKLIVLLVWSLGLALVAWIVSILIGLTVVSEVLSLGMAWQTMKWFIVTVFLVYATLPSVAWLAMWSRGYIVPIGFALVTAFSGLIFLGSNKYSKLFPWTIPTAYALSVRPDNPGVVLGASSWAVMATLFVLGAIMCLLHLRYADVDK
ncbi:MAG: ABC transporter permease [Bacillota bacterium]|nr:ABC transporter permease [Bacillota bacterium]